MAIKYVLKIDIIKFFGGVNAFCEGYQKLFAGKKGKRDSISKGLIVQLYILQHVIKVISLQKFIYT